MCFFDENIFFFPNNIFFNNSTLLKGIFQPVQTLLLCCVYIHLESMTLASAVSNVGLFIAMIGAIACHKGCSVTRVWSSLKGKVDQSFVVGRRC